MGDIIVIFNDLITINRAAHVIKIANILDKVFNKYIILVSKITYDSLNDLSNLKSEVFVMDSSPVRSKILLKFTLLREWMISIIQVIRIREKLNTKIFLIMGTQNFPLVLAIRLFLRKKAVLFAGGFVYTTFKSGISSINKIREKIAYVIEALTIALSNCVLIEGSSMRKYVPLFSIFKNKIIDKMTLYVENEFFQDKPILERRYDIGYIGALESRRSIPELLTIIKNLAKQNSKFKLIIIGDGSLSPYVEMKIKEIKVDELLFLKYIPHKDLPKYMSELKLLLFLSKSEGLPNTILEAMACGTIVMATPVGGVPDVIEDKKTGFLINLNPCMIVKNIIKILQDNDLMFKISKEARERAKIYSIDNVVKKWKILKLFR
ncbi:MAG: glycosyltransferase [Candidatus Methanomethyliaceae archaeon]